MRVDRRELAAIFAGGFVGAIARAELADALPVRRRELAVGDVRVNVAGAFLLGYLVTRLQERLPLSAYRRPLLGTGFCGALTTFSTMQVELLRMLDAGRVALALVYAVASVAAGLRGRRPRDQPRPPRARDRRMSPALVIGIGLVGGAGAIARFLLDGAVSARLGRDFPFGTLAVNLSGAFVLGVLVGAALERGRRTAARAPGSSARSRRSARGRSRATGSARTASSGSGRSTSRSSLAAGVALAWLGRELGASL